MLELMLGPPGIWMPVFSTLVLYCSDHHGLTGFGPGIGWDRVGWPWRGARSALREGKTRPAHEKHQASACNRQAAQHDENSFFAMETLQLEERSSSTRYARRHLVDELGRVFARTQSWGSFRPCSLAEFFRNQK